MIALGAPEMLALLAVAPLAGFAFYWRWRKRRLAIIVIRRDGGGPITAGRRRRTRAANALFLAAIILTAVAAARPQIGSAEPQPILAPADLVIAIDVSQSMAARDIAPSRWTRARDEALALLDARRGRRAALVIFAGDAYVRFPLTRDIDSAKSVLRALRPGESLVPPGSDPAAAIEAAAALLENGGAIVLISDGESHDDGTSALRAATEAAAAGISVHAVSVGTRVGAEIPLEDGSLKIDARTGEPALSRADPEALRAIAEVGSGRYINASLPGALAALHAEINAVSATRATRQSAEDPPRELHQWFAAAALALLIASVAVRVVSIRIPKSAMMLAAIIPLLAAGCSSSPAATAIADGNRAFNDARYIEALQHYRRAQQLAPADEAAHLNAGKALHALEQYDRAETATARALNAEAAAIRASAWYQIGNHRAAAENYISARQAYIQALRADPAHNDAKINLELVNAQIQPPEIQPQPQADAGPAEESGPAQSAPQPSADPEDAQAEPGQAGDSETPGEQGESAAENPAYDADAETTRSARDALRQALQDLPLENATPEQALAVLDALRAVPGQPLSTGASPDPAGINDW